MSDQAFKDRFFDEKGLPEFCYCMDRVNNVSILVKRGEKGYYQMDYDLTAEGCKFKNEQLGIDPFQVMAMSTGSMFGWDVPGADPEKWRQDAEEKDLDIEGIIY